MVEKAIGKEVVKEAFDFTRLEAQIEDAEEIKKTEF